MLTSSLTLISSKCSRVPSFVKAGDTILGMGLSDGGHLTHGSSVNFSGKIYRSITYGVDHKTGLIDYDELDSLAVKHRPKVIIGGFSAYSRFIDWNKLRDISSSRSIFACRYAHVAGLVAAGLYPSQSILLMLLRPQPIKP